MLWVRIPLREGVLDTTVCDQETNKTNGTDYSKKYFGYKWTPATTIHNYTNSNNGKSLFIDVLHFSHYRVFKNEHNSYPKMSVKRPLASILVVDEAVLYFCRWTLHLVIFIILMSFGVYNFISQMFYNNIQV